jgi:CO dehydrogenase/acetyl-CoA synthase gamma subunit (corrinoid Fe-S protein)
MSNYKFKTTKIKGKDYVEVNERIKFFRQEDQYNKWSIQTEFPVLNSDECVCRCTITDYDGIVIAQGHAHELKSNGMINKTSYVENCETSAVGRALAMLGIGIDTSIASANEVENAIAQQDEQTKQPSLLDKSIEFIKAASDKNKAFDTIISKKGNELSEKQIAVLKRFIK